MPGNAANAVPAQFLTTAGGVSAATRTIVTEFEVDNQQESLLPGSYVSVRMSFPSDPNILTVPAQALLFRAEGMQVAAVGSDDKVHLQTVTVGETLGLKVQVTSGLSRTDKIVASPSLGMLEGQQVDPVTPAAGSQPGSNSPVGAQAKLGTVEGTTETQTASSVIQPDTRSGH